MSRFWVGVLVGTALMAAWACGPRSAVPETRVEAPTDPDLQGPDLFADVTADSRIAFTYRNAEEVRPPALAILESLGGGVALIDFDGDGLMDVFLPGGGYYDGPGKKQIKGHPCKLYRNLGNGRFKDVTAEVGLGRLAGGEPWFYTHAAAVGDFDCDGWPDLLVTGWGRVALFRNVPRDPANPARGRRFVDVSEKAGLSKGITWATSAAWADLDGDGFPDLYVCQYVDWSWDNNPACSYDGKVPDVCPPKNFTGLPHKVFRNNRDGTFRDVSLTAGLRAPRTEADYAQLTHLGPAALERLRQGDREKDFGKGLGVVAVDVNGDGKPDVYVANDTTDNLLYVNRSKPGQILFEEVGLFAGVARNDKARANGSMGVDAGDPDGSGRPVLWVTAYENETHALYRNLCDRERTLFMFHTSAAGIAAIGQSYVGWGTGFLDVDHHGWEDLFIANGHAIRYPTTHGGSRRQRPVLLRNSGGKFKDVSDRGGPYFRQPHLARGVALGDLDNDGKVDLIVSHMNEPVTVLRNVAPEANHWVGVELVGKGHHDVVGARVELEAGGRRQTRFCKGGGSYASSGDRRHVFGVGKETTLGKLTVTWPDGKAQEFSGLAVDRYHRLIQGKQKPVERPGKR